MNSINKKTEVKLLVRIRILTLFFITALIVSGITAFPIEEGLSFICSVLNINVNINSGDYNLLQQWIYDVYQGVTTTNRDFPFLAYGTDWLAFAHIVIAISFIGVYIKPVRNLWVVYWAIIACILVIPLAFICGPIRGIPLFWILIDCSFGVIGIIPLILLLNQIKKLARVSGYIPHKY